MEEGEAAAVGGESAPQIVPAGDLVDGFVLDQLLERDRGGIPVDPLEREEAAVEPRAEQVLQVRIDAAPLRPYLELAEHFTPHRNQRGRPAGCRIEPAEELLPRCLHAALELDQVLLRGMRVVGLVGGVERLLIGSEFGYEAIEERGLRGVRQGVECGERVGARDFAALRDERVTQLDRGLRALACAAPFRGLDDRSHQSS